METIEPNITGEGPRREFKDEAEWQMLTRLEFNMALGALLAKHKACIDFDIQGDACVDAEVFVGEYAALNGEPTYFYQTFPLLRQAPT